MSVNTLCLLLVTLTFVIVACTPEGVIFRWGRSMKARFSCVEDTLTVPEVLWGLQHNFWWHVDSDEKFQATMLNLLKPHTLNLMKQVAWKGPGKRLVAMLESNDLYNEYDLERTIRKIENSLPENIKHAPSAWKFFAGAAKYVLAPDRATVKMFQNDKLFKGLMDQNKTFLRHLDQMVGTKSFRKLKKVLVPMFIDVDGLVDAIKTYLTTDEFGEVNIEETEVVNVARHYRSSRTNKRTSWRNNKRRIAYRNRLHKLKRNACPNKRLGTGDIKERFIRVYYHRVRHDKNFDAVLSRLYSRKSLAAVKDVFHHKAGKKLVKVLERTKFLNMRKLIVDMKRTKRLLPKHNSSPPRPWGFVRNAWPYVFPEFTIRRPANSRTFLLSGKLFKNIIGSKKIIKSLVWILTHLPGYGIIKRIFMKVNIDLDSVLELTWLTIYNKITGHTSSEATTEDEFIIGVTESPEESKEESAEAESNE